VGATQVHQVVFLPGAFLRFLLTIQSDLLGAKEFYCCQAGDNVAVVALDSYGAYSEWSGLTDV
jgi:hypothetical protein